MGLVFTNGRSVDFDAGLIVDGIDIRIEGNEIVEVGQDIATHSDDVVYDLKGRWVLPGLIDLHVHLVWDGSLDPVTALEKDNRYVTCLKAAAYARDTLMAGVTTVRDLGSTDDIAISLNAAAKAGVVLAPRIVAAGQSIVMTGGHDPFWAIECDGPDAARQAVRRQASVGAEVIKISATGGVYGRTEREEVGRLEFDVDELRAICREAHRRGMRVAAHCIAEDGIDICIEAGVDTIEHGHFLTEPLAERMVKQDMTYVPTLFVYRTIAEVEGIPDYARAKARPIVERHRKSMQIAQDCGLRIGVGSDAGSPNLPHPSVVDEMIALSEAGLGNMRAIRAATQCGAEALGMGDTLGTIAVGKLADLVVADGDPVDDLEVLRKPSMVVKDGKVVLA